MVAVNDYLNDAAAPASDIGAGDIAAEQLCALYREMLRIRLIEEAIADRYSEQKMRCPVHLSIGQEAVAVGVCAALNADDQVISTHRCHAHYLAKGGDLKAMLAEIHGRSTGCCGGRGGSMHLFDAAAGVMISLPIVASSVPLAVGAALAFKQRGESTVAVAFIGDATVEEGVFHESANFAALLKLPMIFACENNLYSVYTPLAQRQPDRPLDAIGQAHDIPVLRADGNDAAAVEDITRQAAARARAGAGPSMLICDTYRWREHCGPNYDNQIGYRTEAEFQRWKELCPLVQMRARLRAHGIPESWDKELTAAIAAEIDAAFDFAISSPFPEPESANSGVYA